MSLSGQERPRRRSLRRWIGLFAFVAGAAGYHGVAGAADGVTEARSIVIADMRGSPRYLEDQQVAPPPGASPEERGVFVTPYVVYEADFHIRRTLAGPTLGRDMKVLFIGGNLDRWRDVRVFMVIGRDKSGEPWAATNWNKIEDQLCLSRDTIRELNLASVFDAAKAAKDGDLCIPS